MVPIQNVGYAAPHSSVFNALGSYADRIKDANGNPVKITSSPSTFAPKSTTSRVSSVSPSVSKDRDSKDSPAAQAQPQPAAEDDGPWETVQPRQRPRPEEKRGGSSSKNWRDRSIRDETKEKSGEDGDKRSGSNAKGSKKGANNGSSAPSTSSTAEKTSSARPTPAAAAPSTTKPAWGAVPPVSQSGAASTVTPAPAAPAAKEQTRQQSSTVASSPSLNGTTLPGSSSSPNPSSEAASTATAVSKTAEGGEEGSWRVRPAPAVSTAPAKAEEPLLLQPAPPPAVNVWDLRKKTAAPAPTVPAPAKATGEKAQMNGNTHGYVQSNGHGHGHAHGKEEGGKVGTKKKSVAESVGSTAAIPPIHDANLWPDVAQAVETLKAAEDRKEKTKEKAGSETASVEETAAAGKKPKWTPIPASELLAAADQAAEHSRRQSRLEAKKRSATKGEGETSAALTKGAKPRKSAAAGAGATEAKKGSKSAKTGEGEIRLPPQPQGQRDASQPSFKPVFGTVDAASELGAASATAPPASAGEEKKESKPESKSSRASQRDASPSRESNDAAFTTSTSETLRAAPQSKPMTGSTTAPLPQYNFNPASNPSLPRPPRGRDSRGSLNGRGRGGFRSTSAMAHKGHPYTSPPMGVTGLPVEGMVYPGAAAAANGNLFARGYGMGFQPFYPAASYGQPGMYEAMQAQYGNMGMYGRSVTMPPPVMPQTMIPNLDSLRFYVLGQVEYYFSMQNLAMDFFLRQQMDSEGWIDISTIASFNRVKSLTPDIAIVRECMTLSSFLEVREGKVRISGANSHRWVLPDARPSTFGTDPRSPSGATDASHELPAGASADSVSASGEGAAGQEGQQQTLAQVQRGFVAQEVENALMKSSVAVSAATNTMNGEEKTETIAPSTSMSGDGAKDDEREKETGKVEAQ